MRKGELIYRCIDKGCGYEFTGTHSKTDGKRCPKCNGPLVPITSEYIEHVHSSVLKAYGLKQSDLDKVVPSVDMQYEAFIAMNVEGDDTDG